MAKTKQQNKNKVEKFIFNILFILSLIFFVWFIWSFIDVNIHNLTDPQNISEYNIFYLMVEYIKAHWRMGFIFVNMFSYLNMKIYKYFAWIWKIFLNLRLFGEKFLKLEIPQNAGSGNFCLWGQFSYLHMK